MKIETPLENIFVLKNFLSESECEKLIYFADSLGFKEAEVAFPNAERIEKGIRNNERVSLVDIALSEKLFLRAKEYLPQHIDSWCLSRFHEKIRFYRYKPSQRFKMHQDGRCRPNEIEESRFTFMVYLNDNFQGGETRFQKLTISPEKGKALCFLHELKHEGGLVYSGCKYVLRFDVVYEKQ